MSINNDYARSGIGGLGHVESTTSDSSASTTGAAHDHAAAAAARPTIGASSELSASALRAKLEGALPEQKGAGPADGARFDDASDRFGEAIEALRTDPGSADALRPQMRELEAESTSLVNELTSELKDAKGKLAKAEKELNWFEDWVWNPAEVDQMQADVADLSDKLDKAKAMQAGSRLALRMGQDESPEADAGAWKAKLDGAARDIPKGGSTNDRADGVADLIKVNDDVAGASARASLEQKSVAQDVETFYEEGVAWHQSWGWVDTLIGGESAEGALYRAGKELRSDAGEAAQDLDQVEGHGSQLVRGEVSGLLKAESPEYAEKHGRYELLREAWRPLTRTLHDTKEAISSLDQAEQWINTRNMLQAQEPTKYETVTKYDSEGNHAGTEQQITSRWRNWDNQFENARRQVSFYSRRAESEVSEINGQLPQVKNTLGKLDESTGFIHRVDDDISNWLGQSWGYSSIFGSWSFDGADVNRMQDELKDLSYKLSEVKGRVQPQYDSHKSFVDGAIRNRTDELRSATR
jgi:chromosome segregation ATPase